MIPDVSIRDITALAKELRRMEIEFVITGGSALERRYPVGTQDIDVVVALKDYSQVIRKVEDDLHFQHVDTGETITTTQFRAGTHWITVEFINPILFAGPASPDEFMVYVRRYRSHVENGIRFANPEIVWYMRLATEYYAAYIYKIRRDVTSGVPLDDTLTGVMEVARHLGIEERIKPRIEEARRTLALLPHTAPSSPPQRPS